MGKSKPSPPPGGYYFPRIAKIMREQAGITQTELARRMGVTAAAVSQFEDVDTTITEQTLLAYAAALGARIERALPAAILAIRQQQLRERRALARVSRRSRRRFRPAADRSGNSRVAAAL